jgi:hypothetical protein
MRPRKLASLSSEVNDHYQKKLSNVKNSKMVDEHAYNG